MRSQMDGLCVLQNNNCNLALWRTWKSNNNNNNKTLITKPFSRFPKPITHSFTPLSSTPHAISQDNNNPTNHISLLVETFHEHKSLKALLHRLNKDGSCPLQMLQCDGDWSKDHFWAVIRFLEHSSRSTLILQVFDMWKGMEKSRINIFNYEKIIELLGEAGLMEDVASAFVEMKSFGLSPSLQIYNSIIHGYARNGMFNDALFYLNQMRAISLSPESETYDGLIEAYGKYEMYDEMGMCLKRMELDGCKPDRFTYNLLIQEYARGGLLARMERVCQSMRTKKMDLRPTTLIAMLEAYANFGIVEKMEKTLRRVWYSKTFLKDDLIRKLAEVYIKNYMFSRLHDLGDDLGSTTGRTDIVWWLRLLSHACLLSRKGMDSVIREMEEEKVSWNITVANIILLAYLKMKDFTRLRILLSKLPTYLVKPDIVTVGILFNAIDAGFDGTGTLETWGRMGLIYRCVEMNTDPLVLTAFGKGQFLKNCEEAFSSLEPKVRETKRWTYYNIIDLVAKHNGMLPQLKQLKRDQELRC